jgi:predicted peroxiredoxin
MVNGMDRIIILKSGNQDKGVNATLAFCLACTSLTMNKKVILYLTMEGTVWALKDSVRIMEVGGFEPLTRYIQRFISLGGKMFVSAPCIDYYCSVKNEEIDHKLLPGVKPVGLSTIVDHMTTDTAVITF